MKKLAALVFTHSPSKFTRDKAPYMPIQLGKALHPDMDLGYLCDNTGDNISEKNASWNELTGIYWAWKNLKDVEYVATNHYRRYFDIEDLEKNIDKYFKDSDVLVVNTSYLAFRNGAMCNLSMATSAEDAWIFLDTALMIHPEYGNEIKRYFFDNHIFFRFNMFVMPKELFDEYCAFIFPILFAVEKRLKEHAYSRLKRAIGYMGEWSLGMFIICRGLKFKEMPWTSPDVENMSHTPVDKQLNLWKRVKRKQKYWFELHRKHKPISLDVFDDIKKGLASDGIFLEHIK